MVDISREIINVCFFKYVIFTCHINLCWTKCGPMCNINVIWQKLKGLIICALVFLVSLDICFISYWILISIYLETSVQWEGSFKGEFCLNARPFWVGSKQGGCKCPELLMTVAITRYIDLVHWQIFLPGVLPIFSL